jgi:hypothetical protein
MFAAVLEIDENWRSVAEAVLLAAVDQLVRMR